MTREERIEALKREAKARILILDGAMGTIIQRYKLDETGYRGDRFTDHARDLKGNNDLLVLTRPKIVSEIHDAYLEAEGGSLHHVLYGDDGAALAEGASIVLQCRPRSGELRCTRDTYGERMTKLGGAFLAGLLLLGLVLSPEIRERWGS